jgi:Protein of unknown function (DUF5818)
MKKAIITTLMLLAGATWAVAQNNPGQKDQSSSSDQPTTIQGCLGRSDGSYTLTDKTGATYELTSISSGFQDHVGHTVEITGTKSESATATGNSKATTKGPEAARIDVSKLKHISTTCSAK